ncbi:MmgE/PrpD family protein [Mailhella massiliensis]|uniref:MmgE/PrpD family protein n=1 Tax=Mailhella massiliensis TaxID=1903261 RepID=UPI0023F10A9A|nr:MmgE/PrpD family protein [Mailhella massiliensis]
MDAIHELAQFAYETHFEDIPSEVVAHEKLLLLDTLGCLLAGSSAPGCREIVELMREYGGREESSFLVFGGKALAKHAAMANATLIQARDFDDNHDEACCHPHCSCLPPVLAMAELVGGKTGKDMLEAIILALEVQCRIGMGITSTIEFARTGTLGFFGATVGAAKILGLTFRQLLDALGIVYAQVSTTLQSNRDGALVKRMHPAFAVQAGIFSCQLAQKGITGARNVLEGRFGYMNLYEKGNYDRSAIFKDMGSRWEVSSIGLKNYPCARDTHAALDCACEFYREGVDFRRIRDVEVTMPDAAYRISYKPYDEISGHAVVEAILNGAYCTAVALVRGRVEPADFTEARLSDPDVVSLARKVRVVLDEKAGAKLKMPQSVKLTMEDGSVLEKTCHVLKGHSTNMLTPSEVEAKFRMCAPYAVTPMLKRRQDIIIADVHDFENITPEKLVEDLRA